MILKYMSLFLILISSCFANDEQGLYESVKDSLVTIKIVKKNLNRHGRVDFFNPEKVIDMGIGFYITENHIVTAKHVLDRFRSSRDNNVLIAVQKIDGTLIKNISIGKCDATSKEYSPDICLLKTDSKGKPVKYDKHRVIESSVLGRYGVVELDKDRYPLKGVISGEFLRFKTMGNEVQKGRKNRGLTLYETTIQSDFGYSGSPVFNLTTKKLLGMTTGVRGKRLKNSKKILKMNALVIPVHIIRKFLNSNNWEYKEISPKRYYY